MPPKKPANPESPPELRISAADAKSKLEDRVEKGRALLATPTNNQAELQANRAAYDKWNAFNTELLRQIFTTDELAKEYGFWGFMSSAMNPTLGQQISDYRRTVEDKIDRIDSIIGRLELYPLAAGVSQVPVAQARRSEVPKGNKVFIVHGHDETQKNNLEIFVREIGLDPIVLHRKPDQGLTLIEKFEEHSDVAYALILLTPDEIAYLREDEPKPDSDRKKEYRARPNVIFEFGYFIGKLGRRKVCCLYTGDVTLPSDLKGLVYKRYNQKVDEIAYELIKELRAAGFRAAQ